MLTFLPITDDLTQPYRTGPCSFSDYKIFLSAENHFFLLQIKKIQTEPATSLSSYIPLHTLASRLYGRSGPEEKSTQIGSFPLVLPLH